MSKQVRTQTITTPAVDRTPPIIQDFQWQPSRVVNGKVYDAVVSFTVEDDDSGIADTRAILQEYVGSLPAGSYPEEAQRTLQLAPPLPTVERTVRFSGQVGDLKGGKRYRISMTAKDSAGNAAEVSRDTPYVREFENAASDDDFLVGAHYYAWFTHDNWRMPFPYGFAHYGNPLLGEYASSDPFVISKHVDWATGHGIDFFMMSWWGPGGPIEYAIENVFTNPRINDGKLVVTYESAGRLNTEINEFGWITRIDVNNPHNRKILSNDIDYLCDKFLGRERYLRIEGSPVIFLYSSRFYSGDVSTVLRDLRQSLRDKYGMEIFILGDEMYWGIDPDASSIEKRLKLFDGVTCYSMHTSVKDIIYRDFEKKVDKVFKDWAKACARLGVRFVPNAFPGYDDRRLRVPSPNLPFERSIDGFRRRLETALKYLDEGRMLTITSFNEWGEYTCIEPSQEYGFDYLNILRDSLTG